MSNDLETLSTFVIIIVGGIVVDLFPSLMQDHVRKTCRRMES